MTVEQARTELQGFEEVLTEVFDSFELQRVSGPTQQFAVVMAQRLRATFLAGALLINGGHIDPAIPILRRQLEDSMRLHFLYGRVEARDRDAVVLRFIVDRETAVRRRIDSAVSHASDGVDDLRNQLLGMAAIRRERIAESGETAAAMGINLDETEAFPTFEKMAEELNRRSDIVPYASMSEAVHSAFSALTDAYVKIDNDYRISVAIYSAGADRAGYARTLINSTGFGELFAFKLIDQSALGEVIGRDASQRIERMPQRFDPSSL